MFLMKIWCVEHDRALVLGGASVGGINAIKIVTASGSSSVPPPVAPVVGPSSVPPPVAPATGPAAVSPPIAAGPVPENAVVAQLETPEGVNGIL
ncbi:hypothetical protein Taro_010602 [Colocasia esculenta]|uniref:Uncharacterized protein n=1 Tax=Colocasia esculenta TaxID=4460 RepID=A0A843U7Z3_COLES|nr:hypothetical protein [Colocasia esculenta]